MGKATTMATTTTKKGETESKNNLCFFVLGSLFREWFPFPVEKPE